jgi:L-threonine kinase
MAKILAAATMPATLGEWVQGWIGDREALVSLVVAWNGSVELCTLDRGDIFHRAGEKTLRAFDEAKKIFSREGDAFPEDGFVNIINPLPPTRGLATSTMDVAGTFASCAAYVGNEVSEERLFSLCAGIEPSDGIMFKGLALVDHINGKLIERLPPPPEISIVALIPSRTLDTAEYRRDNARLETVRANANDHELAYEMLKRGLTEGDVFLIAKAATKSAETQQKIMPREEWGTLGEISKLSGAIGIAVAHSGTASGLLFDPSNKFGADLAENMLKNIFSDTQTPDKAMVRRTVAAGGGFFAEKI